MGAADAQVTLAVCHPLAPRLMDRIQAMDDRLVVQSAQDRPPADDTEVAFGWPDDFPGGLPGFVQRYPRLRWVQSLMRDVTPDARGVAAQSHGRVAVTSAAAADARPLAEFAMAGILAFSKQLARSFTDPRNGEQRSYPFTDLAGATLLVLGLGPVGAQVAHLGNVFGMHVIGVNRNGRGSIAGLESLRPPRFLGDLLPISHAVVVTLPRTEGTLRMIGASQIARMRRDAVLVDLSGGGVVEEQPLQDGLQQGQPAAAVLDVLAMGPLFGRAQHTGLSNVLVGTGTTGSGERRTERIAALFVENLQRYLQGEELHDMID